VSKQKTFPTKNERKFNEFLVEQYFKYGTVNEVFRKHRYSLPISQAGYHRVLDRWGVVKAAGPNSKLTEALEFLWYMAHDNIPLEELYKKIPTTFQTSAATMYRILGYVKEGITRRVGVSLVMTSYRSPKQILLAKDISTPRVELGKTFGSLTIPTGFAKKLDGRRKNITRILQQEVFTKQVISRAFSEDVIPNDPEPFMYLDIADVRVSVYHIQLPKEFSKVRTFASFKLENYKFVDMDKMLKSNTKNLRVGVVEAVSGYKKYLELLERNLAANPLQARSIINKELATVKVDIEA
jgi:hypothetical protein